MKKDIRKRCIRCENPINKEDKFFQDKKTKVYYCLPCLKNVLKE